MADERRVGTLATLAQATDPTKRVGTLATLVNAKDPTKQVGTLAVLVLAVPSTGRAQGPAAQMMG